MREKGNDRMIVGRKRGNFRVKRKSEVVLRKGEREGERERVCV